MADCKGCGAKVQWLKHETTGKQAPVNLDVNPEGNVLWIASTGTYRVLSKTERDLTALFPPPGYRTTLHFVNCPETGHFRHCKKCHKTPCKCVK